MYALRTSRRHAAFTLVELIIGLAVAGTFMALLLRMWMSLTFTGVNTTAYAARQNDQMRVLDYLKRDIRRATAVEIYNGATLVTGTSIFGNELRLHPRLLFRYARGGQCDRPEGHEHTVRHGGQRVLRERPDRPLFHLRRRGDPR